MEAEIEFQTCCTFFFLDFLNSIEKNKIQASRQQNRELPSADSITKKKKNCASVTRDAILVYLSEGSIKLVNIGYVDLVIPL